MRDIIEAPIHSDLSDTAIVAQDTKFSFALCKTA
jgi:hypothetical protein